eukprot:11193278-Lingulodinium_polyedra.AAC.1
MSAKLWRNAARRAKLRHPLNQRTSRFLRNTARLCHLRKTARAPACFDSPLPARPNPARLSRHSA